MLNCSSATSRHVEAPQVTLKLGSKLPLVVLEQPKCPLEEVERVLVAGGEMSVRPELYDQRPLPGDDSTCPRYMFDSLG
jgi:hypothetical protein